ncbi:MAG: hypothetical protein Q9192_009073, partial [Flavoplaca navasiana]
MYASLRIEESFLPSRDTDSTSKVAIGFLRIKFKHFINLEWCGTFASFDLIRPVIIFVMIIKSYGQPAALGTWDETLRSLRRSRALGPRWESHVASWCRTLTMMGFRGRCVGSCFMSLAQSSGLTFGFQPSQPCTPAANSLPSLRSSIIGPLVGWDFGTCSRHASTTAVTTLLIKSFPKQ